MAPPFDPPIATPTRTRLAALFAGVGLALGLGSFEGAAVQGIFPYLGGSLSTSSYDALWTLTYFVVHWSLGITLMPWTSRRFGQRAVFQGAVVLAMVGTLISALTHNLWIMLVSRAMEGLGAGLLVPLSQSLFLQAAPARRHGLATVFWSNAMLLPFFIGPALGGWLAVGPGFRFIFWVSLPLFAIAFWLGSRGIEKSPRTIAMPPFDFLGFGLLYAGLMSMQVVLDQGEQHGWWHSPFIREASLAAFGFLYLFAWHEGRTPHPLLQFHYLKRRNYLLGLALLSLGWALFMGWASILPLWAEEYLGYNGLWGGLLILPIGLGALPMSTILDRLRGLLGLRRLASLSFLLLAIAYGTLAISPTTALSTLFRPLVLLGLGVGVLFVPLTMIIMSEISPALIPSAATTANFIRVFSANIGVTMLSVYWSRDTALAGNALRAELPRYGRHAVSQEALQGFLMAEAHTLSLDNLLRISMWLCLGASAIAWFFLIPPRALTIPPVANFVEETKSEVGL